MTHDHDPEPRTRPVGPPPPPHVFDCGCRIDNVDDTAVLTACPAGEKCDVVRYAKEVTEESGKSYTVLDAR